MANSSAPLENQTYLVYVDDSGDEYLNVLSAFCIPAVQWAEYLQTWRKFRKWMHKRHQVPVAAEFHSVEVGSRSRPIGGVDVKFDDRSNIADAALRTLGSMSHARILAVCADGPSGKIDLYADLVNLVEQFCAHYDSRAAIWFDGTDATLVARRRRIHRGLPYSRRVIEDPQPLDSKTSSLIQMADVTAHLTFQDQAGGGRTVLRQGYSRIEHLTWSGCDEAGCEIRGALRLPP